MAEVYADRRDELLRQSRDSLKRKCKRLRLSGEGSKSDIIDRLIRHMMANNNIPAQRAQNPNERSLERQRQRKLLLQRRLQYNAASHIKPTIIIRRVKKKEKSIERAKHSKSTKQTKNSKQSTKPKPTYLTFQFVGIRPPNIHRRNNRVRNEVYQFDDIKVKSLIVQSILTSNSTISDLKTLIRQKYGIPKSYDILILYSHVKISGNNAAKLKHFGITNHSLLTIGVSKERYYSHNYGDTTHRHLFSSIKKTKQSTKDEMKQGLDIITQENDVNVYKMPGCGHLMSKESLYFYALSTFKNQSNLYLTCPHVINNDSKYDDDDDDEDDEKKYDGNSGKWSCPECTYINRARPSCAQCGIKKPQNNLISTNQCNSIWHYSLIKQILSHKPSDHDDIKSNDNMDLDVAKLELLSARNRLENAHNDKRLNVQKCYNCDTLHVKTCFRSSKSKNKSSAMDKFRQFKTSCIICKRKFCWNCGKKHEHNHLCDGSHKLAIFQLLKTCQTKTIGYVGGVPTIRACPNTNCGQLITHVTACKHMRCRSCSISFCFVCMKPTVNGRWQCGGSSDRCAIAPRQTFRSLNMNRNDENIKKQFQLW